MPNLHPRLPTAPTGFRRLTPSLLQAERAAACFDGLPEGIESPAQLLAALKAAAAPLGLSMRLVHALDWLFRFTRPQDWQPGARPIVWPSASLQAEALGLSASQVKAINRGLIAAGLITMKDSANGKRYGKRDRTGRIVEAYGFDLSPIVTRYAEFVRVAAEAKAERVLRTRLHHRVTIASRGIGQILETVAEYGFGDDAWPQLRRDAEALTASLGRAGRITHRPIWIGSRPPGRKGSQRRKPPRPGRRTLTKATQPPGPTPQRKQGRRVGSSGPRRRGRTTAACCGCRAPS
jgi:replication initiation protein RepC